MGGLYFRCHTGNLPHPSGKASCARVSLPARNLYRHFFPRWLLFCSYYVLPVSCKSTDMPGEKGQHQAPVDDGRRRGLVGNLPLPGCLFYVGGCQSKAGGEKQQLFFVLFSSPLSPLVKNLGSTQVRFLWSGPSVQMEAIDMSCSSGIVR